MTVKTIKNVTHDLLPIINDLHDQIDLLENTNNDDDRRQLMDAAKNTTFLVKKYLISLEKDYKEIGIEKN